MISNCHYDIAQQNISINSFDFILTSQTLLKKFRDVVEALSFDQKRAWYFLQCYGDLLAYTQDEQATSQVAVRTRPRQLQRHFDHCTTQLCLSALVLAAGGI